MCERKLYISTRQDIFCLGIEYDVYLACVSSLFDGVQVFTPSNDVTSCVILRFQQVRLLAGCFHTYAKWGAVNDRRSTC